MSKETDTSKKTSTDFGNDKRRRHQHWLVTIIYTDKQEFSRVYLDIEKGKEVRKAAEEVAGRAGRQDKTAALKAKRPQVDFLTPGQARFLCYPRARAPFLG